MLLATKKVLNAILVKQQPEFLMPTKNYVFAILSIMKMTKMNVNYVIKTKFVKNARDLIHAINATPTKTGNKSQSTVLATVKKDSSTLKLPVLNAPLQDAPSA